MPQYRYSKTKEVESLPENIEIDQASGAKLVLQGRLLPNRQTIWAILRKVQSEVEQWTQEGKDMPSFARDQARDTLRWAARLLYCLGSDYEDIIRDLGSLATLAELEAPKIRSAIGQTGDVEHGL